VSELLERLRRGGRRLTAQRRIIAEVLDGPHLHLTAEEILARARRQLPEISLATVYSTLKEFVALDEVAVLTLRDGRKRYDPNTTQPHHHLVCTECGKVLDVYPEEVPSLSEHERHDFVVRSMDITFRGHCPDCRAAGHGSASRRVHLREGTLPLAQGDGHPAPD
jgi:Fur family transcriptional regulator, stress-responsive regulator